MTRDDYRILQVQKDEQHIFDKREIQGWGLAGPFRSIHAACFKPALWLHGQASARCPVPEGLFARALREAQNSELTCETHGKGLQV